jgi:uncharacterized protein DUF397
MTWRKSSFSGTQDGGDCVEVAFSTVLVGLRDSKNSDGPTISINALNWRAFLATTRQPTAH